MLLHEAAEEAVERAGGDPGLPAFDRLVECGHEPVDVPAGLRRQVDPRRPLHLHQLALDLAVEVVAPLLVDQVPLVERDHQGSSGLPDGLDDPLVLLGDRRRTVDDQDGHLGPLDGGRRTQRGVVLVAGRLLDPLADASGVDEPPLAAAERHQLVHRVHSGARHVVDDDPVRARQLVEQ